MFMGVVMGMIVGMIVSVAAKGIAIMRVPVIVRDPQGMGAVMLRFAQRDRLSRCRIRQSDCLCV
jgi:hypothetical protein